jgi:hypothetical protein
MKPCADVADDTAPDFKKLVTRWGQDHSFREYDFFVALWCALEQQGFSDICLRQEPYEVPHNLWRFSARRGVSHCTFIAVERALRRACESLGRKTSKDSVAAMVCGPRARGVFMLPLSGIDQRNGRGPLATKLQM